MSESRAGRLDAAGVRGVFDRAAEALLASRHRRGSVVALPARGRLLATGDLHDNPRHLGRIIRLARLDASPDHHVVLQEMIHSDVLVNGVDLSHRMLARVAELVLERPGQIHPLPGNHELAQMSGERVSRGAGDNVQLFNDGLAFAFGDDWPAVAESLNRFIRAMPLAARSDSGVLCAHSLPAGERFDRFDPGVLERPLTDDDYRPGRGSAWLMVWGRRYGAREVEALARRWDVRVFCVGHEHVEAGVALRAGRVIVLNSDHALGAVLPIDLADVPDAEELACFAVRLGAVPDE